MQESILIDLKIILITALVLEAVCLYFRFGMKMKSPTMLKKIGRRLGLHHVLRVHHLFIGIIIAIFALLSSSPLAFNLGAGIALSDLLHHAILTIATGNPEFHLAGKDLLIEEPIIKKRK